MKKTVIFQSRVSARAAPGVGEASGVCASALGPALPPPGVRVGSRALGMGAVLL